MNDVEIRLLDKSFKELIVLTEYSSFIWNDVYCGAGDFEMSFASASNDVLYIKNGYYISCSLSDRLMVVESIVNSNDGLTQTIKVSGRSAESLLDRRVIMYPAYFSDETSYPTDVSTFIDNANMYGHFIASIKDVFDACFKYGYTEEIDTTNSTGVVMTQNSARAIDNIAMNISFENDPLNHIRYSIANIDSFGDSFYDVLCDLCEDKGFGFALNYDYDSETLYLTVYDGKIRDGESHYKASSSTRLNTRLPSSYAPVIFSLRDSSLSSATTTHNYLLDKNFVYVKGESYQPYDEEEELDEDAAVTNENLIPAASYSDGVNRYESSGVSTDNKYGTLSVVFSGSEAQYNNSDDYVIPTKYYAQLVARDANVDSGFERREVCISSDLDRGDNINSKYATRLTHEGRYKLVQNYSTNPSVDAQLGTSTSIYGEDYNLGDVVLIEDTNGNTTLMRVSQYTYSIESGCQYVSAYPVFEEYDVYSWMPDSTYNDYGDHYSKVTVRFDYSDSDLYVDADGLTTYSDYVVEAGDFINISPTIFYRVKNSDLAANTDYYTKKATGYSANPVNCEEADLETFKKLYPDMSDGYTNLYKEMSGDPEKTYYDFDGWYCISGYGSLNDGASSEVKYEQNVTYVNGSPSDRVIIFKATFTRGTCNVTFDLGDNAYITKSSLTNVNSVTFEYLKGTKVTVSNITDTADVYVSKKVLGRGQCKIKGYPVIPMAGYIVDYNDPISPTPSILTDDVTYTISIIEADSLDEDEDELYPLRGEDWISDHHQSSAIDVSDIIDNYHTIESDSEGNYIELLDENTNEYYKQYLYSDNDELYWYCDEDGDKIYIIDSMAMANSEHVFEEYYSSGYDQYVSNYIWNLGFFIPHYRINNNEKFKKNIPYYVYSSGQFIRVDDNEKENPLDNQLYYYLEYARGIPLYVIDEYGKFDLYREETIDTSLRYFIDTKNYILDDSYLYVQSRLDMRGKDTFDAISCEYSVTADTTIEYGKTYYTRAMSVSSATNTSTNDQEASFSLTRSYTETVFNEGDDVSEVDLTELYERRYDSNIKIYRKVLEYEEIYTLGEGYKALPDVYRYDYYAFIDDNDEPTLLTTDNYEWQSGVIRLRDGDKTLFQRYIQYYDDDQGTITEDTEPAAGKTYYWLCSVNDLINSGSINGNHTVRSIVYKAEKWIEIDTSGGVANNTDYFIKEYRVGLPFSYKSTNTLKWTAGKCNAVMLTGNKSNFVPDEVNTDKYNWHRVVQHPVGEDICLQMAAKLIYAPVPGIVVGLSLLRELDGACITQTSRFIPFEGAMKDGETPTSSDYQLAANVYCSDLYYDIRTGDLGVYVYSMFVQHNKNSEPAYTILVNASDDDDEETSSSTSNIVLILDSDSSGDDVTTDYDSYQGWIKFDYVDGWFCTNYAIGPSDDDPSNYSIERGWISILDRTTGEVSKSELFLNSSYPDYEMDHPTIYGPHMYGWVSNAIATGMANRSKFLSRSFDKLKLNYTEDSNVVDSFDKRSNAVRAYYNDTRRYITPEFWNYTTIHAENNLTTSFTVNHRNADFDLHNVGNSSSVDENITDYFDKMDLNHDWGLTFITDSDGDQAFPYIWCKVWREGELLGEYYTKTYYDDDITYCYVLQSNLLRFTSGTSYYTYSTTFTEVDKTSTLSPISGTDYYIKVPASDFTACSSTMTEFESGVTYYIRVTLNGVNTYRITADETITQNITYYTYEPNKLTRSFTLTSDMLGFDNNTELDDGRVIKDLRNTAIGVMAVNSVSRHKTNAKKLKADGWCKTDILLMLGITEEEYESLMADHEVDSTNGLFLRVNGHFVDTYTTRCVPAIKDEDATSYGVEPMSLSDLVTSVYYRHLSEDVDNGTAERKTVEYIDDDMQLASDYTIITSYASDEGNDSAIIGQDGIIDIYFYNNLNNSTSAADTQLSADYIITKDGRLTYSSVTDTAYGTTIDWNIDNKIPTFYMPKTIINDSGEAVTYYLSNAYYESDTAYINNDFNYVTRDGHKMLYPTFFRVLKNGVDITTECMKSPYPTWTKQELVDASLKTGSRSLSAMSTSYAGAFAAKVSLEVDKDVEIIYAPCEWGYYSPVELQTSSGIVGLVLPSGFANNDNETEYTTGSITSSTVDEVTGEVIDTNVVGEAWAIQYGGYALDQHGLLPSGALSTLYDYERHWNLYTILTTLGSYTRELNGKETLVKIFNDDRIIKMTGVSKTFLGYHRKGVLTEDDYNDREIPIEWHNYSEYCKGKTPEGERFYLYNGMGTIPATAYANADGTFSYGVDYYTVNEGRYPDWPGGISDYPLYSFTEAEAPTADQLAFGECSVVYRYVYTQNISSPLEYTNYIKAHPYETVSYYNGAYNLIISSDGTEEQAYDGDNPLVYYMTVTKYYGFNEATNSIRQIYKEADTGSWFISYGIDGKKYLAIDPEVRITDVFKDDNQKIRNTTLVYGGKTLTQLIDRLSEIDESDDPSDYAEERSSILSAIEGIYDEWPDTENSSGGLGLYYEDTNGRKKDIGSLIKSDTTNVCIKTYGDLPRYTYTSTASGQYLYVDDIDEDDWWKYYYGGSGSEDDEEETDEEETTETTDMTSVETIDGSNYLVTKIGASVDNIVIDGYHEGKVYYPLVRVFVGDTDVTDLYLAYSSDWKSASINIPAVWGSVSFYSIPWSTVVHANFRDGSCTTIRPNQGMSIDPAYIWHTATNCGGYSNEELCRIYHISEEDLEEILNDEYKTTVYYGSASDGGSTTIINRFEQIPAPSFTPTNDEVDWAGDPVWEFVGWNVNGKVTAWVESEWDSSVGRVVEKIVESDEDVWSSEYATAIYENEYVTPIWHQIQSYKKSVTYHYCVAPKSLGGTISQKVIASEESAIYNWSEGMPEDNSKEIEGYTLLGAYLNKSGTQAIGDAQTNAIDDIWYLYIPEDVAKQINIHHAAIIYEPNLTSTGTNTNRKSVVNLSPSNYTINSGESVSFIEPDEDWMTEQGNPEFIGYFYDISGRRQYNGEALEASCSIYSVYKRNTIDIVVNIPTYVTSSSLILRASSNVSFTTGDTFWATCRRLISEESGWSNDYSFVGIYTGETTDSSQVSFPATMSQLPSTVYAVFTQSSWAYVKIFPIYSINGNMHTAFSSNVIPFNGMPNIDFSETYNNITDAGGETHNYAITGKLVASSASLNTSLGQSLITSNPIPSFGSHADLTSTTITEEKKRMSNCKLYSLNGSRTTDGGYTGTTGLFLGILAGTGEGTTEEQLVNRLGSTYCGPPTSHYVIDANRDFSSMRYFSNYGEYDFNNAFDFVYTLPIKVPVVYDSSGQKRYMFCTKNINDYIASNYPNLHFLTSQIGFSYTNYDGTSGERYVLMDGELCGISTIDRGSDSHKKAHVCTSDGDVYYSNIPAAKCYFNVTYDTEFYRYGTMYVADTIANAITYGNQSIPANNPENTSLTYGDLCYITGVYNYNGNSYITVEFDSEWNDDDMKVMTTARYPLTWGRISSTPDINYGSYITGYNYNYMLTGKASEASSVGIALNDYSKYVITDNDLIGEATSMSFSSFINDNKDWGGCLVVIPISENGTVASTPVTSTMTVNLSYTSDDTYTESHSTYAPSSDDTPTADEPSEDDPEYGYIDVTWQYKPFLVKIADSTSYSSIRYTKPATENGKGTITRVEDPEPLKLNTGISSTSADKYISMLVKSDRTEYNELNEAHSITDSYLKSVAKKYQFVGWTGDESVAEKCYNDVISAQAALEQSAFDFEEEFVDGAEVIIYAVWAYKEEVEADGSFEVGDYTVPVVDIQELGTIDNAHYYATNVGCLAAITLNGVITLYGTSSTFEPTVKAMTAYVNKKSTATLTLGSITVEGMMIAEYTGKYDATNNVFVDASTNSVIGGGGSCYMIAIKNGSGDTYRIYYVSIG